MRAVYRPRFPGHVVEGKSGRLLPGSVEPFLAHPRDGAAKGVASVAFGQKVCQAKNTARFRITPTTAAVMAVSGAVNLSSPRVASTS